MKTLKNIFTILIITAVSFGAPSLQVFDNSSYSVSIGKSYDLIDSLTPMNRTYTGVWSLKEKTELGVNHSGLLDNIAVEQISLVLKDNFVKGLRFGGYFTYLSFGGINNLDISGSFTERLEATDYIIGIPIIFNVDSLNLNAPVAGSEQTGPSAGMISFLNSINGAVNFNYYSSKLAGDNASSLFADINVSGKFKVGYLGAPEELITEEDVEEDKKNELASLESDFTKKITSLEGDEKISETDKSTKRKEYESEKEAQISKLNETYKKKQDDIKRVSDKRKDIYKIYKDIGVELKSKDINYFIKEAKSEITVQVNEASNAIHENNIFLLTTLLKDVDKNQANVSKYQKLFKGECKDAELKSKCEAMFDLYKKYTVDAYKKEILDYRILDAEINYKTSKLGKLKKALQKYEEENKSYTIYKAVKGDTWGAIAEQKGLSISDLKKYNTFKNKKEVLGEGQSVRIPIQAVLQKRIAEKVNFENDKKNLAKIISGFKMTQLESIYYKNVITLMDKRSSLYKQKGEIASDIELKYTSLNNLQIKRYASLDKLEKSLNKSLKKIVLKKQLDLVNSRNSKETKEAIATYKKSERVIFKRMLLEIFRSKKELVNEFIKSQKEKAVFQDQDIKKVYKDKFKVLREDNILQLKLVGDDKDKKTALGSEYKNKVNVTALEFKNKLVNNQKMLTDAVANLNWDLYTTELIYLSSDDKLNTFAIGGFAKNLGLPVSYGSTDESLPLSFGFDLNYEFLNIENHISRIYAHYGNSVLEGNVIGGGIMYRVLNFFELRGGAYLENGELLPAAAAAMLLDIGLMSYRFDGGVIFKPNYGPVVNVGVNILF